MGLRASLSAAAATAGAVGVRAAVIRAIQEARLDRMGRGRIRRETYSHIWGTAAATVGAEIEDLGGGRLRIHAGAGEVVTHLQECGLNAEPAVRRADDRELSARMLAEKGVRLPEHLVFDVHRTDAAERFAVRFGPCVVKPARATGGGSGVTGGVRTRRDLASASRKAARWGERAVIEQQATGLVYRVLLLDGQLLDVVERTPPLVAGDGRSSVARLIQLENEERLAARRLVNSLLRPDLDTVLTLRAQGLTLRSVPDEGARVQVKATTSQNAQRENRTWRGRPAEDVLDTARQAADVLGLRLVGLDVVTSDLALPLERTKGVVIDVNGQPGLQHHYLVADPDAATPVAVPILRAALGDSATG